MTFRVSIILSAALVLAVLLSGSVQAQAPAAGPPAVGVVRAQKQPITQTSEFVGRVAAIDRVALVARVTAFLEQMFFTEGAEVKQGDLLYRLEQPPFQADLAAKQASVQQTQAQLQNATLTFNRASSLLRTPAGQQSTVDDSRASMLSNAAQVQAAQAQERQSQINLDYTEIRAPISGKIGRTAVTAGNVVSPSSGTLTTIVSQDPMYVVFPVSVRTAVEMREHYANGGGFSAVVIRIRLPNGRIFDQTGKLNFIDNTVSLSTDTLILRGSIPNPPIATDKVGGATVRELTDGEFVTVMVEGVQPLEVLTVPRAAVLSDQRGDYVYTVDAQNKVQQTRIQLGQSTPTVAAVISGLNEGEMVVVDGIQRVRPGIQVLPGPASPPINPNPAQLQGASAMAGEGGNAGGAAGKGGGPAAGGDRAGADGAGAGPTGQGSANPGATNRSGTK